MKKYFTALAVCVLIFVMCLGVSAAIFQKTKDYGNGFSDVTSNTWYYSDVKAVYEMGIMQGMDNGKFDTEGDVSVAQAITIAARIHSTYYGKSIREEGGSWYTKYVEYAIRNDIVRRGEYDDYTRPILSHEMVNVFAHSLPSSYFAAINDVQKIPDVSIYEGYHDEVLLFYRAGILNGDERGNFSPNSTLTRKRAAAIITRMVLNDRRVRFTMPAIPKLNIERHLYQTVANVDYWDSEGRAYILAVTPSSTADVYLVDMICCDVKDVTRQARITGQINVNDESCGILQLRFENDKYNNNGCVRLDFSGDKLKFTVVDVRHNLGGSGKWGFFNSSGYMVPVASVISDYEKILNPTEKPKHDTSAISITRA